MLSMNNNNSSNFNVKKLTKNDIGKKISHVDPPYNVYGFIDTNFTNEIYVLKDIIKSPSFGYKEVFVLVDSKGNETETYPQHTVGWAVVELAVVELAVVELAVVEWAAVDEMNFIKKKSKSKIIRSFIIFKKSKNLIK